MYPAIYASLTNEHSIVTSKNLQQRFEDFKEVRRKDRCHCKLKKIEHVRCEPEVVEI